MDKLKVDTRHGQRDADWSEPAREELGGSDRIDLPGAKGYEEPATPAPLGRPMCHQQQPPGAPASTGSTTCEGDACRRGDPARGVLEARLLRAARMGAVA